MHEKLNVVAAELAPYDLLLLLTLAAKWVSGVFVFLSELWNSDGNFFISRGNSNRHLDKKIINNHSNNNNYYYYCYYIVIALLL